MADRTLEGPPEWRKGKIAGLRAAARKLRSQAEWWARWDSEVARGRVLAWLESARWCEREAKKLEKEARRG